MDKYIIKNCPAYFFDNVDNKCTSDDNVEWGTNCQDCTDCVMKQIVEKCKKEIEVYRNTILPNDGTNTIHFGRQSFAYDILKLLDLQEVE